MSVHELVRVKTSPAGGGGGSSIVKACGPFLLLFLFAAAFPFRVSSYDLIATTASGRSFVLAKVEKDAKSLELTAHNSKVTLEDPIVHIAGLDQLEDLIELRFYQVPQIASFDFLRGCVSLKRLVISFGRVRSVGFLSSLPELELIHLEFCSDWESEYGLPFLKDPLDLAANTRLEYLAFRICDLKRVPVLLHVPKTLAYVDLSYNRLQIGEADAVALESLKGVGRVFVHGNSVSPSALAAHDNLVLESGDAILSHYLAK